MRLESCQLFQSPHVPILTT